MITYQELRDIVGIVFDSGATLSSNGMAGEADKKLGEIGERLTPEEQDFVRQVIRNMLAEMLRSAGRDGKDGILAKFGGASNEFENLVERARVDADKMGIELLPSNVAVEAFRKTGTPIPWLNRATLDGSLAWDKDEYMERKAYIFACFSELAYLQRTKYDLPGNGRYKVVPSEALENLIIHDLTFGLDQTFLDLFRGDGITVAIHNPGRGFLYATFATPYFVVVAVRGTSSISEALLIDANARKFWDGECGYHRGFYKEAVEAMGELQRQPPLAQSTGVPIYFTGHSMGAAISWIFRNIWINGRTVMTPYLYASPRIGNKDVTQMNNVYSHIRPHDPVPLLPPLCWGYADSDTHFAVRSEDPSGLWGKLSGVFHYHSIEQYRIECGKKTKDPFFNPDVYFNALYAQMQEVHRMFGRPFLYGPKK